MAEKKNYITSAALARLEDELKELESVRMPAVSRKIKEAREQGDLSENAEYDAARDEQRDIQRQIDEKKEQIRTAVVLPDDEIDLSKAGFGCAVKVFNMRSNKEVVYQLVGSIEADSLKGKISNESPIGRALMGREVNDIVDVEAPAGVFQLKILEIAKAETEN